MDSVWSKASTHNRNRGYVLYAVAKFLPKFWLCFGSLSETKVKGNRQNELVEKIQRQPKIQAVECIYLSVLTRYIMRIGAKCRKFQILGQKLQA